MIAISLVLLFICRAQAQNRAAALSFTGNVERDFPLREGALPPTVAVQVAVDGVDTGVPPGWPYMFTGWDFKDLRFVVRGLFVDDFGFLKIFFLSLFFPFKKRQRYIKMQYLNFI